MDPVSTIAIIAMAALVAGGVLVARRVRYARAQRWTDRASRHPEAVDPVDHRSTGQEVKDSTDPRVWESTIEPGTRSIW